MAFFNEKDHPRADDGKFTNKDGGGSSSTDKSKTESMSLKDRFNRYMKEGIGDGENPDYWNDEIIEIESKMKFKDDAEREKWEEMGASYMGEPEYEEFTNEIISRGEKGKEPSAAEKLGVERRGVSNEMSADDPLKLANKMNDIQNHDYKETTSFEENQEIDWDLAQANEKINGKDAKSKTRKDKYGNPLVSDKAFNIGVKAAKSYVDYMTQYDSLETLKKSNVFLRGLQEVVDKAIINNGYNPDLDTTYQDYDEIIGNAIGEEVHLEAYESNATKGFTGKKYSGYTPNK